MRFGLKPSESPAASIFSSRSWSGVPDAALHVFAVFVAPFARSVQARRASARFSSSISQATFSSRAFGFSSRSSRSTTVERPFETVWLSTMLPVVPTVLNWPPSARTSPSSETTAKAEALSATLYWNLRVVRTLGARNASRSSTFFSSDLKPTAKSVRGLEKKVALNAASFARTARPMPALPSEMPMVARL